MASVILLLYKHSPTLDGKYPVKIRIIHNRKSRYITTGEHLAEKEWDEDKDCVSRKHPYQKTMNIHLSNKRNEIAEIVLDLERKNPSIRINELMNHLKRKTSKQTFQQYANLLIIQMKKEKLFGNAGAYEDAISQLKMFNPSENLMFEDITLSFLEKWERWHLAKEKGNHINSLNTYLRSVRAIYNRAIRDHVVGKEDYPFTEYKIKGQKTRKRAIKKEIFAAIRDINLTPDDKLFYSWKYFMFSFYCRGMNWKDLCLLKWKENIVEGRIEYKRAKTKTENKGTSIKITPQIQEIINAFWPITGSQTFIFPIITEKDPERIYKQIKNRTKKFNSDLREIAKMVGIKTNLTSYVARHSWASIANSLGTPIGTISEGLGHKNISTTQIYIDDLDTEALDAANAKITKLK